jgi:predicted MFS family arabinose efflux permease
MATKAAAPPSTSGIAIKSLIVLILVNIMNFYDRHVGGALAEPIRREFALTDAQLGLIASIFTWLYAVVGLPMGILADRMSRKRLLSAGIVVWGTLTGFAAWASSYSMLLVSRLGLAVGESACAPIATSWIGDLYPPEKRSRPLALFMLGVPVGGALSFFFSGPIAQAFGWRRAMIAAAIPALLLVPVVLMLREPARGAAEPRPRTDKASVFDVLLNPTFWWIIFSGALVNFNLYALGTFLPAFMGRIHHLKVGPANIATGVIYLVGGLLGGTLGGYWGDRIVRHRPDGRMLIAALAALIASPAAFIGVRQGWGSLYLAVVFLTLAYGLLNMYYGLVYASIQDFVAPAVRGTAMAIYFLAMYALGASFGPYLTGRLSDFMARRAAAAAGSPVVTESFRATGLQQAMFSIPVLAFALALVLWGGSRSIAKRAERQEIQQMGNLVIE